MFGLLDFVAHIYGERHSVSWIVDWEILRKEWPMIVLQVDVAKFADHWPLNFGLYLENFKSFSEVMCKKLAFFLLFLVPNIPPFAIKSRYNMFVFFSFIFMKEHFKIGVTYSKSLGSKDVHVKPTWNFPSKFLARSPDRHKF